MEKITLKKQDITKLIQVIREQEEEQEPFEVVEVTPDEIHQLLPAIDYNLNALSKLRKYRDKKIVVNGNLKLRSNKSIKSLGPIIRINGDLDIVDSGIASLDGVKVTGRISDWGSEMAKIREKRRVAGELAQAQSRREDNEWSLENADEEGLCAIAVFQYLQEEEPDEVQSEEDVDRLRQLKERRGNIYYDQEQGNDSDELQDELDSIDVEIEEIEEKIDVYSLIPSRYSYYGKMRTYEIYQGNLYGNTYVSSTEDEAEKAALQYAEEYVDEHGVTAFNEHFWMDHLDEEGILDYFRDFYEDDIRNNPDVYFDDDDFELTTEQEERKEQLENYIEEMEQLKSDTEDEQSDLEDSDSDEYYELDEKIKEIESNIETAQEELDEIEPDKEPTQDMIDRKVDYMLDDVKYDYRAKLDEFGMDISEYVDKDALAQAYVDSDGIGIMNGYDGTYETTYVNDETYVVMRTN
jgi:hypothetical protein